MNYFKLSILALLIGGIKPPTAILYWAGVALCLAST